MEADSLNLVVFHEMGWVGRTGVECKQRCKIVLYVLPRYLGNASAANGER